MKGNEHVYQIELDRRAVEETVEGLSRPKRSLWDTDSAVDIEQEVEDEVDLDYQHPMDYLNHFLTDSVQRFPIIRFRMLPFLPLSR